MASREPGPPPQIPGYAYVSFLGSGGHADVFQYVQDSTGAFVAIKVLAAQATDPFASEQLQYEGQLMAMFADLPGVVRLLGAGTVQDSRPYLVLEYCPGPTLSRILSNGPMAVSDVLFIGGRIGATLQAIHEHGVLHRDIKPSNIIVDSDGQPRLADFGVATSIEYAAGSAPAMSIPWVPPEMLGDQPVASTRSDIYSLGATLYTALSGRPPLADAGGASSDAELLSRALRSQPAPIQRDDLPQGLQAVLLRAMSKDPDARYQTAAEFASVLQQMERSLGNLALPPDASFEPLLEAGAASAPSDEETLDAEPTRMGLKNVDEEPDSGATRVGRLRSPLPKSAGDNNPQPDTGETRYGIAAPRPVTDPQPDNGQTRYGLSEAGGEPERLTPRQRPFPTTDNPTGADANDETRLRATTVPTWDDIPSASVARLSPPTVSTTPLTQDGPHQMVDETRMGRGSFAATGPDPVAPAAPGRTESQVPVPPGVAGLVQAPRAEQPSASAKRRSAGKTVGIVAAAVVLVAAMGGIAWSVFLSPDPEASDPTVDPNVRNTAAAAAVPAPTHLTGARQPDGSIVFTWKNPDPKDGDQYLWGLERPGQETRVQLTDQASVSLSADEVAAADGAKVCVRVSIVRKDRRPSNEPARGCLT